MSHAEPESAMPAAAQELSDARKQFHDRMEQIQGENASLKHTVIRLESMVKDLGELVALMRRRLARHGESKVDSSRNAALDNHEEAGI